MKAKRLIATMTCLSMLFSMTACGGGTSSSASAVPKEPTTPGAGTAVTIEMWHTRGAGASGDQTAAAVERFNATNGKNIVVEQIFQGNYVDSLAKTVQSIAAGNSPEIVVLERAAGVPMLAAQGVLLDMKPYAERDKFDVDNFMEALLGYSWYEGQLVSLPYVRSMPTYFYNKGMFEAAGITEAPKTIEELEAVGKKLTSQKDGDTIYGFEMLNDPGWFIQNMTCQLGSNLFSEDGKNVPSLEDGTMLKVLTAWRKWVDDGWCMAPDVTKAESVMKDRFNQGKLASYFASSGGTTNILKNAEAANIDVGIAFLPTWDQAKAPTGGGNIAIIKKDHTDAEMDAAWEFMKFLMTDEEIADNASKTGYLPTTKSAANSPILKELWEKTPEYKVAYDQLSIAQEVPWSDHKAEFEEVMKSVCSKLIIDRSITPEQAVEELKTNKAVIFGS